MRITLLCLGMFIAEVASEACVEDVGYTDHVGNKCTHYTNNPDNCKHEDARKKGSNGQSPCQHCCVCGGCPTPAPTPVPTPVPTPKPTPVPTPKHVPTCGNTDSKGTKYACGSAHGETLKSDAKCQGDCDALQCCHVPQTCWHFNCSRDHEGGIHKDEAGGKKRGEVECPEAGCTFSTCCQYTCASWFLEGGGTCKEPPGRQQFRSRRNNYERISCATTGPQPQLLCPRMCCCQSSDRADGTKAEPNCGVRTQADVDGRISDELEEASDAVNTQVAAVAVIVFVFRHIT